MYSATLGSTCSPLPPPAADNAVTSSLSPHPPALVAVHNGPAFDFTTLPLGKAIPVDGGILHVVRCLNEADSTSQGVGEDVLDPPPAVMGAMDMLTTYEHANRQLLMAGWREALAGGSSIDLPLPAPMRHALQHAMNLQIERDALVDPRSRAGNEAGRNMINGLLARPAGEVVRHPVLKPLFQALHEETARTG